MVRALTLCSALALFPAVASAQQPCTNDARQVVNEIYRTVLERSADRGSNAFVQRLMSGTATVRDIVREIAKSPEHVQRFAATGNAEANQKAAGELYRHLLGRQADPNGQKAYAEGIGAQGINAAIDSLINSDEYTQKYGDAGVPGSQMRYCGAAGQISSGARPNGRFRNMDVNGDGTIARSEWQGSPQAFEDNDWNRDGILSGDELRPGATRRSAGQRAPVATSGATSLDDQRFDALDRNQNGRLERNEWNGTAATFDRLDTNRNNILSRAEVVGSASGASNEFIELDRNRDGRLSIQEWNWNRRTFEQQDTNGDGVITQPEFTGAPTGAVGR